MRVEGISVTGAIAPGGERPEAPAPRLSPAQTEPRPQLAKPLAEVSDEEQVRRAAQARARAESAPPPAEPRRGEESRLRFWRIQFHYAPGSAFAAEKLAAELRNLIFDLLEHQERMNRDEVAHAAATGALELPPPVRALLLEQQHWSPAGEIDSLQRLREMLYALLRKPPPEAAPSPFEQDVELIVAWIEGRLKEPGVA